MASMTEYVTTVIYIKTSRYSLHVIESTVQFADANSSKQKKITFIDIRLHNEFDLFN